MTLKIVEGNILDVTTGTIFQQVNCQGVMGAGLAKQIAEKWPKVLTEYQNYCFDFEPEVLLGDALSVEVIDNPEEECFLDVVNLFGQLETGTYKRQTHYGALAKSLAKAYSSAWLGMPFYFPYGMSSGLAGGDWNVVQELIEGFFPYAVVMKLN